MLVVFSEFIMYEIKANLKNMYDADLSKAFCKAKDETSDHVFTSKLGVLTLYNVCSVHRGMFSTSGGYHEYIGGIP